MTIESPGKSASMPVARWAWPFGVVACAVFAGLAASYPLMVHLGTPDLWAAFQAKLTSADYTFGPHSSEARHPIYARAIHSFSLHTIAGSVALLVATTQFMPALRRRWPRLHRAMGAAVIILVAASMVGSLLVQASHPLAATLSGAGFGIGLASLAGLTLAELALAVLAVRARDYRSHMGWMALMFASLLTAPALRVQWLLFGFTGLRMDQANLAIAMFQVPETCLLMACWVASVGASDLGLAAPRSILPPSALMGVALSSAAVAFHEGFLAPLGFDLIRSWRGAGHPLPCAALVWGLATSVLALRVPRDMTRISEGAPVRLGTLAAAGASILGALIVAGTLDGATPETLAKRSFYASWAIEIALLMILGRRAVLAQVAPWDAQWLFIALAPGLWPFLACSYIPLSVGAPIAIATAMTVGYATIAVLGFASAFGIKVVVAKGRRSSRLPLSRQTVDPSQWAA